MPAARASAPAAPPAVPAGIPTEAATGSDPEDPLPGLVAEALRNNPGLKAARLEAGIAREEGEALLALPPPQAGVEFHEASLPSFPDPVGDQAEIGYFIQQTFPFPGKRRAAAAPSRRRAAAEEARAREMEVDLARRVKEAYLDLGLLEARGRINADNQSLVRRFADIARKQYEVGMGAQADILAAHSELAALAGQAIDLAEAREEALARLNALLGRAPGSAFGPPPSLRPRFEPLPLEAVLAVARRRHPGLALREAEAGMRAAEAEAARRERLPDLMLRGDYRDMREAPLHGGRPEDAWGLMVAVDLPLAPWSAGRSRGGYRAAGARAEQARLGREAEENRLAAEIAAALARHRAAGEKLELARVAMVPQAEQALQGVQAAYTNGKAGFMDLLAAYRMAIAARTEEQEAAVKVLRSRADVEAAAGAGFEELAAEARGGGTPAPAPARERREE